MFLKSEEFLDLEKEISEKEPTSSEKIEEIVSSINLSVLSAVTTFCFSCVFLMKDEGWQYIETLPNGNVVVKMCSDIT